MKKLVLALFAFSLLIICSSCSLEDMDDSSTVLGEWKLSSMNFNTPIDLNNDGTPSLEFSAGCLTDSALNFMDATNGTIFYSSTVTNNTRFEDNKLVYMTACSTDSDRVPVLFSYSVSNDTIVINYNGEEFNLTQNGNTLSLSIPNGFIAKDIDTFETTVSEDVTYVFTR